MKLRSAGLTQAQVAKRLRTTRENVLIHEHRAHENLAAKATLAVIEESSGSKELVIPSGVSIFEATSMILRRADVLRIKVKMNADSILALLRSKRFSLKNIDLAVPEGSYFVLLGTTCSEKTLLLEAIAGAYQPKKGQITVNGKASLTFLPKNVRSATHRKIIFRSKI